MEPSVTFEDVAVEFSLEEWSLLEGSQKDLHQEVMLELCSLLLSLGEAHSPPPPPLLFPSSPETPPPPLPSSTDDVP
uniref:KRAB domain-containing protein n=1 Tax=Pseudonaja textilis TaxID=8673 RepID=A0A670ZQI2_PSETE